MTAPAVLFHNTHQPEKITVHARAAGMQPGESGVFLLLRNVSIGTGCVPLLTGAVNYRYVVFCLSQAEDSLRRNPKEASPWVMEPKTTASYNGELPSDGEGHCALVTLVERDGYVNAVVLAWNEEARAQFEALTAPVPAAAPRRTPELVLVAT